MKPWDNLLISKNSLHQTFNLYKEINKSFPGENSQILKIVEKKTTTKNKQTSKQAKKKKKKTWIKSKKTPQNKKQNLYV